MSVFFKNCLEKLNKFTLYFYKIDALQNININLFHSVEVVYISELIFYMDSSWLADLLKSQDDTNKDLKALVISVTNSNSLDDDKFDVDKTLNNLLVELTDDSINDFDAEKALNQMVDEKKEKERQFFIDLKNTLKADGVLDPFAELLS